MPIAHKTFFIVNGAVHCSEPIPTYPHCRLIYRQWRFIGLPESVDTLRHQEVSTVISFVNSINLALAIPTNDKETNLITVVDSNFPNINKISVHMKGSITGVVLELFL